MPNFLQDLDDALFDYRRRLEPFRKNTRKRMAMAAGANYGPEEGQARPANFSALAASILAYRLMSGIPQVLYHTDDQDLEESALEQEAALNRWIRVSKVGRALNEAVVHAIYAGIGIMQTGIRPFNSSYDPGAVRCEAISLDDWVHDMGVDHASDFSVLGHRYRANFKDVKNDEAIPKSIRKYLQPSDVSVRDKGNMKISSLSRGDRDIHKEFLPKIELWQLYFPRDRILAVFQASDHKGGLVVSGEPLRVVQWEGPPELGPYDIFGFMPLPSNTIGLAPSQQWEDFDDAMNVAARKLIYDIRNFKKIGIHMKQAKGDAVNIAGTPHGNAVGLDNPESFKELALGAPDPVIASMVPQLRQLASLFGGNLDQIGGISTQADTARQENLLHASSSLTLVSMSGSVTEFTSDVLRHAAGWLFSDPQLNMRATKRIPGTDLSIPFTMTADRVQGTPDDFRIDITPYSLQFRSPQEQLQLIGQVLQGFVMPWAQGMMQQGGSFDFQFLVKEVAHLSGWHGLERFVQFFGPYNPNVGGDGGAMAGSQGGGTREYVRKDRGADGAPDAGMIEQMASMAQSNANKLNG